MRICLIICSKYFIKISWNENVSYNNNQWNKLLNELNLVINHLGYMFKKETKTYFKRKIKKKKKRVTIEGKFLKIYSGLK